MGDWFDKKDFCCAARSAFGRRAEPERERGRWSEAQPNGEGVASGSATPHFLLNLKHKIVKFLDVCKKV